MTDPTLPEAIEAIYASIVDNNKELDANIAVLKRAMAREGVDKATFETAKLVQPNRQGRKLMESYFRKKGVAIAFV